MRLTEITKDEFAAGLKDPFMGKVLVGVNKIMHRLNNAWKLTSPPTYDDYINKPVCKDDCDLDYLVFKISRKWSLGTNKDKISSAVAHALGAIKDTFDVDVATDTDHDWGERNEWIYTIIVSVHPSEV